ncbi:Rap guanine nucleotide exchange factor 4 [Portunus trituberculatus]|uniref:Rap guanine nucleotide exchange factor 4 n=1 Tax=Portunus trituberculatus TaxID=210409 RepID=A0A5B7HVS3_PORTR|nr:Rap guanine nucleotide exchange factor 4 [Portunus trituberculatus]
MTAGASFGESVLSDAPRRSTIITRENCELLRVEQRDFRHIWQTLPNVESYKNLKASRPPGYFSYHVLEVLEDEIRKPACLLFG